MRLNKALKLSGSNWKLVLKTVFMQAIIVALVVAVFSLCVSGTVNDVIQLFSEIKINDHINEIIADFLAEDFSAELVAQHITDLIQTIMGALDSAKQLFVSIVWANIGLFFAICVYRFLLGFTDIPTACHLYEFMETGNSRPFIWYFFKNFGKSAKFLLLQLAMTLWMDILIVFGVIGGYVFFLASMGIPGIIIAILFWFFAYSARQTLFAFWLPQLMTGEQGICKSLKIGFQKIMDSFWQVFWKTFVMITLASLITIVINYLGQDFAKMNFSWIIAFISAIINFFSFFIIKCINMVEFFDHENKPYFVKKIKLDLPEGVSD